MPFHTATYDTFVFLGDPTSDPLWYWSKWRQLMRDLDALLKCARGPASVRSTQYLPNHQGMVKFGRIGWKESDQQKWTHRSPSNLDMSPNWTFLTAELWAPAWTQCERENSAPDVFVSIASESAFRPAPAFATVVILAVVGDLARREASLLAGVIGRLRALVQPTLAAYMQRPWGRPAVGGHGFTDSIQDLHLTGLFKPGRPQERPMGLDLFAGDWQSVRE